ncbi:MAG: HAD family hydrolase [Nitrosomonas sp.]|nr:HAD family hydrolase [Nitrosomonas sp.]
MIKGFVFLFSVAALLLFYADQLNHCCTVESKCAKSFHEIFFEQTCAWQCIEIKVIFGFLSFLLPIAVGLAFFTKSKPKKLLILDMNNVLVYRAFKYAQEQEDPETVQYNGSATLLGGKFWTWKRPHLDSFLTYCFDNFTVAVWSSARGENVKDLLDFVFTENQKQQLLFFWDQSHCTTIAAADGGKKPLFLKELKHVWDAFPQYNQDDTILVDDSEEKMRENPAKTRGIIKAWTFGNDKRPEDDRELQDIIEEHRFL